MPTNTWIRNRRMRSPSSHRSPRLLSSPFAETLAAELRSSTLEQSLSPSTPSQLRVADTVEPEHRLQVTTEDEDRRDNALTLPEFSHGPEISSFLEIGHAHSAVTKKK